LRINGGVVALAAVELVVSLLAITQYLSVFSDHFT
jgi:hypothetical protein